MESFRNLQILEGRQTTELSKRRSEVTDLAEKITQLQPKPEPTPDFDWEGVDVYNASQYGKTLLEQSRIAGKESAREEFQVLTDNFAERQKLESTLTDVRKDNPDLTPEDVKALALFGDKRGVRRFDDAFYIKNKDAILKKAKEDGRREVLAELTKGGEIPPVIVNKGTPGGKAHDAAYYDNMSQEDYDALPEDEKKLALTL